MRKYDYLNIGGSANHSLRNFRFSNGFFFRLFRFTLWYVVAQCASGCVTINRAPNFLKIVAGPPLFAQSPHSTPFTLINTANKSVPLCYQTGVKFIVWTPFIVCVCYNNNSSPPLPKKIPSRGEFHKGQPKRRQSSTSLPFFCCASR
jgi:hypothetical protein